MASDLKPLCNRPLKTRANLILCGLLACILFLPQTSSAGCTWKFDWYCSDCAKIGGRTTGTESGYPSESACDSARNSVDSHVTTMSCDRVGWCDEPAAQQAPSNSNSSATPPGYSPSSPNTLDNSQYERMKEERRQREQRDKERKERERRAFEDAKSATLDLLKSSGSSHSGDSGLKLKSGTETFGLKSNPSGELKLKQPSSKQTTPPLTLKQPVTQTYSKGQGHSVPVATTGAPTSKVIDPAFFTRPKQKLTIKSVPNPKQAAKGTWLRYVRSDRAGLILEALEEGKGDLDYATAYLEEMIFLYDSHQAASDALSYLEGLRTSYIATDTAYKRKANDAVTATSLDAKLLLEAIKSSARRAWPGPTNSDPASIPVNPLDWRVQRAQMLLTALQHSPNDLEKTYQSLRSEKDTITAKNAENYLRGVYAYWDFLETQE